MTMTMKFEQTDRKAESEPLLSVRDLSVEFNTHEGSVYALDGVDLDVPHGQIVGLVGETGSGKSVTARSILGLIDDPGEITGGTIEYNGKNLLELSEAGMRSVRGSELSMIFQEPMKSLNPAFTIQQQLNEVMTHHLEISDREARTRLIELLSDLGLPDPEDVLTSYPHELSGGMAQRVLIALALACEPQLILADEPTTALDVTIQAQILELFEDLREEYDTSMLFITHNLGVVYQVCDYVNVMYAGKIVESGPTEQIFDTPKHPYTRGLLKALPERSEGQGELSVMEGDVPDLRSPPTGCRFVSRCPVAKDECKSFDPPAIHVEENRAVRCIHYDPDEPGSAAEVIDEF